jgi:hypothetical protein
MLIIKVTEKLQYNIGELNKKMQVSADIPKYVITPEKEEE